MVAEIQSRSHYCLCTEGMKKKPLFFQLCRRPSWTPRGLEYHPFLTSMSRAARLRVRISQLLPSRPVQNPAGLQHLFHLLTRVSCPSAFTVASLPTIPADTLLLQRSWCIGLHRSHIWLDSTHTVARLVPCSTIKSLLSCTPPASGLSCRVGLASTLHTPQ